MPSLHPISLKRRAAANVLRHEPHPVGDGAVRRVAKQLLATGHYRLNSTFATGISVPRQNGRSAPREAAGIN